MKAEILTIGDEILIGQIINTNSVWIAQQLNIMGIRVAHMATVADEENEILKAFDAASARADFVFITGGLGPTKDDVTKKVFAQYFGKALHRDEATYDRISDFFQQRGREMGELNARQALVPEDCQVIRNNHGTAPGMWMQNKSGAVFISMPGVPYEMKAMMSEIIIPKIQNEYKLPAIYHKTVLTQGIGESALAEMIETWENELNEKSIRLAYLPQTGQVRLRLSSSGSNLKQLTETVEAEIKRLEGIIGKYIFGYESFGEAPAGLEKIVSELLREKKATLSLAESCTGGYISSLIASVPGASEIFRGAIVPYTNEAKHNLLQVDPEIFNTVGAVSRECVLSLATSVRKKFGSDYSLAVSGIAGPTGATPEKPLGTVWIGLASEGGSYAFKFLFGNDRQRNIQASAQAALDLLRRHLLDSRVNASSLKAGN